MGWAYWYSEYAKEYNQGQVSVGSKCIQDGQGLALNL